LSPLIFFPIATKLNMAVKLICNDEEPIENTLRRFKRSVNQSGHLMALRYKEQWETAADKKKRKAESAKMLNRIERTNDRYEKQSDGSTEYNS
jgi:small subunit ribosomal protein S21